MPLIHCPNGYCDSIGNGCCFTKSGNCEQDVKQEIKKLELQIIENSRNTSLESKIKKLKNDLQ